MLSFFTLMSLLESGTDCASTMGLSHGLQLDTLNPKKKHRWLFSITDISATPFSATALPPKRGGRPKISQKEFQFQHLTESIWYPLKAEWQTVNLVLYDIRCNQNPVFDWLARIYDPSNESQIYTPIIDSNLLETATLELYDGCGNVIETWTFENAYPSMIDWGELDMESVEMVMVDLTLRYQRAFFVKS